MQPFDILAVLEQPPHMVSDDGRVEFSGGQCLGSHRRDVHADVFAQFVAAPLNFKQNANLGHVDERATRGIDSLHSS